MIIIKKEESLPIEMRKIEGCFFFKNPILECPTSLALIDNLPRQACSLAQMVKVCMQILVGRYGVAMVISEVRVLGVNGGRKKKKKKRGREEDDGVGERVVTHYYITTSIS